VLDVVLFIAIFAILPALNSIRNVEVGGSATNREVAFHLISSVHVKDAVAGFASWAAPLGADDPRRSANAHPLLAVAGLIVFLVVIAGGVAVALRRRRPDAGRADAAGERSTSEGRRARDDDVTSGPLGALAGVAAIYFACFAGLLVFSISFVDFHTPADERVLSPLFVAWAILGACAASAGVARLSARVRPAAIAACFLLAAVCCLPTISLVKRLHREGDGFTHAQWQRSPTLAAVKQLPPDQQVFTNAPGVVYLLTGRQQILTVPSEINAASRLPNPDYPQLMDRITTEMRAGRGVLVYLRRYGAHRPFYPTEAELKRKLGLRLVAPFSDGAIYGIGTPATEPAATSNPPITPTTKP
jgi:hypothetical protein